MTGTHPLLRVLAYLSSNSSSGTPKLAPCPSVGSEPLLSSKSLKYGDDLPFRHDLYDHPAPRLPGGVTNLYKSRDTVVVHNQLADYALFPPPDLQVRHVLR